MLRPTRPQGPDGLFRRHERQKQLEYEERIINVDHGSFCPLVFSTNGALGPLCDHFLKRLVALLTDNQPDMYSTTMAWIRCRMSFALLFRNSIMCIRGPRSAFRRPSTSSYWERQACIAETQLSSAAYRPYQA